MRNKQFLDLAFSLLFVAVPFLLGVGRAPANVPVPSLLEPVELQLAPVPAALPVKRPVAEPSKVEPSKAAAAAPQKLFSTAMAPPVPAEESAGEGHLDQFFAPLGAMLKARHAKRQKNWVSLETHVKHGTPLVFRDRLAMPLKTCILTSPFGPRWGRMHQGADFGAEKGTPIYASASGVVALSSAVSGYGELVVVDHTSALETRYAHCDKRLVKEGQWVRQGQLIALSGDSGHVTGAHLHFEVVLSGVPKDPMLFLL